MANKTITDLYQGFEHTFFFSRMANKRANWCECLFEETCWRIQFEWRARYRFVLSDHRWNAGHDQKAKWKYLMFRLMRINNKMIYLSKSIWNILLFCEVSRLLLHLKKMIILILPKESELSKVKLLSEDFTEKILIFPSTLNMIKIMVLYRI